MARTPRTPRPLAPLSPAAQFFYDHAGYSHGFMETPETEHRRSARRLASAEAKARKAGIEFEWAQDDEQAYCYCDEPTCRYHEGSNHEWETLYCVAFRACGTCKSGREVLASLSGIMDPDTNYRRVVEAELALEALS